MKNFFISLMSFAALIFIISCGDSKSNDNTDTSETVTDEDTVDADQTDIEPTGDTESTDDTEPVNPDSDDPDTTPEPKPDDDADTAAEENDDDADTEQATLPECGEGSGTPCYDPESELIWSEKAENELNWENAKTHCEGKTDGGHNDWHMPNINELRTLIKGCENTICGGACGVVDTVESLTSCLEENCWTSECSSCDESSSSHSKFGDTTNFWSASTVSDNTERAWRVNFESGSVDNGNKSSEKNVRCVR